MSSGKVHEDIVWRPRDASVAESVAQYSRFVSIMKIALPVAAGILLLIVIVLPQLRQDDERFRLGSDMVGGDHTDALSMTNARYFGTDDKGQPYSVAAEGVRQRTNDDKAVDLVTPKANISLNGGKNMSAAASAGVYDRDNHKLDLSGDVTVQQDQDNKLVTTEATVMLKDGTASGRAPVTGEGAFGKLQASGGFDLSERGKIVHFRGPAKLTINPKDNATPTPVSAPATTPSAAPAPQAKPTP
jgi:lipopolysaccharide export system protein LptC